MRGMRVHESVRPSPIFLALLGLTAVGGVLAWLAGSTVRPLSYAGVFIFVIAGWLVSLCLHEFGHAYTAWRFGDHDVAMRGYLTLIRRSESVKDPDAFWRAHRSYLVNVNRIREVVPWFKSTYQLRMDDKKATEIPVSRLQSRKLREMLNL